MQPGEAVPTTDKLLKVANRRLSKELQPESMGFDENVLVNGSQSPDR